MVDAQWGCEGLRPVRSAPEEGQGLLPTAPSGPVTSSRRGASLVPGSGQRGELAVLPPPLGPHAYFLVEETQNL